MKKEVLLYGGVHQYSAMDFVNSVIKAEEEGGDELLVRLNTNGGDPQYMWSMASKYRDFDGKKSVKVEGAAHSSGMLFLCYANYTEAFTHVEMGVHRAAYPEWVEKSSEYFTEEMKAGLDRMNKSLRAAIEAKIDVEKFEKLKGVTMDEIFSMDDRKTVFLTAKEAKKIGLIDKVIDLTKEAAIEIDSIAASYKMPAIAAEYFPESNFNSNNNKMDVDKLKSEYPEVYASVAKIGADQERDRVQAYMVFADVDIEAVKKGISEGASMSQKEMTELTVKAVSKNQLEALAGESAGDVNTPDHTPEADNAAVTGESELSDVEKLFAAPTAAILNDLKAK